MKLEELHSILLQTELPVAYQCFEEDTSLPFIIYGLSGANDFLADNSHYVNIRNGFIEYYYCLPKDAKLDNPVASQIEQLLEESHIGFKREYEEYIDSEEMFVIRWKIQLIGG